MSRRIRLALRSCAPVVLLAPLVLSMGCSDSDESTLTLDLNGLWTLRASASSPPRMVACTGELSPMSGTALCDLVELELLQTGDSFAGAGAGSFCGSAFTTTGTVSGTTLAGTLVSSDGATTLRAVYAGSGSGDTATFAPDSLTADGQSGVCTVTGLYNGTRQP